MARFTDDEMGRMLAAYVDQRMRVEEWAKQYNIVLPVAKSIMHGDMYQRVKRPEGFAYPWPEHQKVRKGRQLTKEQVEEGLRLYWENGWTSHRLAVEWGVHHNTARTIILGENYKDAIRPWPQGAITDKVRRERWIKAASEPRKRVAREAFSLTP